MGDQLKTEITDLNSADSFDNGDLMLIRKTAQGVDRAINYSNLVKSLGNTTVQGFTATTGTNANEIILEASNKAQVLGYSEGMKISFVSPSKSNGVVMVKIGNLSNIKLLAYGSNSSIVINNNDYIEAVYIKGNFYQVNLNQYVYTNDYIMGSVVKNADAKFTNIVLTSAYGVLKSTYYKGMTANFLCTEDTIGLTRIIIDGLEPKDILEDSGDYTDNIYTPLYKGQIVRLIYDGKSFIKDRFSNSDPKVEISVIPSTIEEEVVPTSKFEYTVGSGPGNFPDLQKAIVALVKEYGINGKGRKVTLNIINDLLLSTNGLYIDYDLSWITLKSANNIIKVVNNNPSKRGYFLNLGKKGVPVTFAENSTIIFDSVKSSEQNGFLFSNSGMNISIENINIKITNTGDGQTWHFYLFNGINTFLKNVSSTGGKISIYNLGGNCALENCVLRDYSDTAVRLSSSASLTITNCDLSKNGVADTSDITITQGCKVSQINSKAKANIPPGTNDQKGTYWVTGSQDIRGTL